METVKDLIQRNNQNLRESDDDEVYCLALENALIAISNAPDVTAKLIRLLVIAVAESEVERITKHSPTDTD